MFTKILKWLVHTVIGTRRYYNKKLAFMARDLHHKTILEIGSGKSINGKYPYSVKHLFDSSNNFICSDIDPTFGHKTPDLTKFHDEEMYDVILCLNVLEHIYETEKALKNLYYALKKEGVAYIAIPVHFPSTMSRMTIGVLQNIR